MKAPLLLTAIAVNCLLIFVLVKDNHSTVAPPVQENFPLSSPLVLPGISPPIIPKVIEPVWTNWPVQSQRDNGTGFFADVINHVKGSPFKTGDRDTQCHETTHGIHSEIRNSLLRGKKGNGFYVGDNRAVLIDEPNMKLADLIPFIPQKLRGNRFKTYLQSQQKDWNSMPTYIFDEGVAYLNGSRVSVEEAKDSNKGKTDAVYSCAEFTVYGTSFMMAVEKHDPNYFNTNTQAKNFVCWYIQQAIDVYKRGQQFEQFRWDAEYYRTLSVGDDGRPLREFMQNKLGMNLQEVFRN